MEEFYERAKPYLWPWVLAPFVIIYVGDLITALVTFVQIIAGVSLGVFSIALMAGVYLRVLEELKREAIHWFKLYDTLRPIRWGYELCDKMLEKSNDDLDDDRKL